PAAPRAFWRSFPDLLSHECASVSDVGVCFSRWEIALAVEHIWDMISAASARTFALGSASRLAFLAFASRAATRVSSAALSVSSARICAGMPSQLRTYLAAPHARRHRNLQPVRVHPKPRFSPSTRAKSPTTPPPVNQTQFSPNQAKALA